jgi:hypothetical protein
VLELSAGFPLVTMLPVFRLCSLQERLAARNPVFLRD